MALCGADLRAGLAASILAHEECLAGLFRAHCGGSVTERQPRRLATALRALLAGLGQRAVLGLAEEQNEQYFADAARALATSRVLRPA